MPPPTRFNINTIQGIPGPAGPPGASGVPTFDAVRALLSAATSDLSLNNQRLTNLGPPASPSDGARMTDVSAAQTAAQTAAQSYATIAQTAAQTYADTKAPLSRSFFAGIGLQGGGSFAADRTLAVAAHSDGSIVVDSAGVGVGILATDVQHGTRGGGSVHSARALTSLGSGFMIPDDIRTQINARSTTIGARCDGTDDGPRLAAAATLLTAGGVLYLPPGTYTINSNQTWTFTIELAPGAILDVTPGHTLTLPGAPHVRPGQQVFTPRSQVAFTAAPHEIYAAWWGAVADGSTDSTTAIQSALTAAGATIVGGAAYGMMVRLRAGRLVISSMLDLPSGVALYGSVAGQTQLFTTSAITMIGSSTPTTGRTYSAIVDVSFRCEATTGTGVAIDWTGYSYGRISGVSIDMSGNLTSSTGIRLVGDSAGHAGYYNEIAPRSINMSVVSGTAGADSVGIRFLTTITGGGGYSGPNANTITGGRIAGAQIGWYCTGIGNTWISPKMESIVTRHFEFGGPVADTAATPATIDALENQVVGGGYHEGLNTAYMVKFNAGAVGNVVDDGFSTTVKGIIESDAHSTNGNIVTDDGRVSGRLGFFRQDAGGAAAHTSYLVGSYNSSRTWTLPDATGTIALTSDLSTYVPTTTTVSAGTNLTGGGALSGPLTLALAATLTGLTSVAAATLTATTSVAVGGSPAGTGSIRLPNGASAGVYFKSSAGAGSVDCQGISQDASDNILIASTTTLGVYYNCKAASSSSSTIGHFFRFNNSVKWSFASQFGGDLVGFIADAGTVPTSSPTSGMLWYSDAGRYRQRSVNNLVKTVTPKGDTDCTGILIDETVSGKVATTDATETILQTYALPTGTIVDFELVVVGYRTGGTAGGSVGDSYHGVRRFTAKRVAGGAVLVGTPDTIGTDKMDATTTVGGITNIVPSAASMQVKVTGAANVNYTWSSRMRIVSVTP